MECDETESDLPLFKEEEREVLVSTPVRLNVSASLVTLPTELLFMIFKELQPVDATCAGLTCKILWAIRNKPRRPQPSKLRLHLNYIHIDPERYWAYCDHPRNKKRLRPYTAHNWDKFYTAAHRYHLWPAELRPRKYCSWKHRNFLQHRLKTWMQKANYYYDESKTKFVRRDANYFDDEYDERFAERKPGEEEKRKGIYVYGVMLIIGDTLRLSAHWTYSRQGHSCELSRDEYFYHGIDFHPDAIGADRTAKFI
ncbi:hypothetical protein HYFRA_00004105 [Hymenoscyphus fraxineus]|uniref:F-box domain-containing protein n=1 Tax=Hymenoscyphus fraxineus TaxID=746836 RepID=A0A9N9KQJ6_9HELO|nr:hypothetical protein HYFRA_00004105 [Hymenoscyphus fraxineus]